MTYKILYKNFLLCATAVAVVSVSATQLSAGLVWAQSSTSTSPVSTPAPTAKPTVAPKKATPKPSASPTPSATASATETPDDPPVTGEKVAIHETTTKLRERLQKLLGDQDENGDIQKAAYIGEVTRISEEAITLKTLIGSEIVPLEESTILLKRSQKIPVSDVNVGNWLIVIGTREKNRAIKPQLLMVQTADLKPREHLATIGAISEISASSISITPRGKNEALTFKVTKNSKLTDATGETMTLKTLPKDVAVVVVGFGTDNGWELGTLKTMVSMAEYKSAPTPTPTPKATFAPKKATPKPSVAPTPTPAQ